MSKVIPIRKGQKPAIPKRPAATGRHIPLKGDEPAPKYMTPAARVIWSEMLPELAERGDCSRSDLKVLQVLCDSLASYEEVRQQLAAEGETITNVQGNRVSHPLRYAITGERQVIIGLAVQFGMTPKARPASEDDEPTTSPNTSADF